MNRSLFPSIAFLAAFSCASPEPQGLYPAQPGSGAEVLFDFFHRPLPEIPLPNDLATRFDPSSPTGRRVNASQVASTAWEQSVRESLDALDGWGTFMPVTVSFTEPLDPEVIYQRHRDNYDFGNDAVYLVDVTPDSPDFCRPQPLDMGSGNFPYTLEKQDYYPNDPRERTNTLLFEEVEEDLNRNGLLDPGEDTDMDGVLDHPNLRHPDGDPVADLMTFYERQTNTLILRPLMPLREETTYAVVLTRRLLDASGRPVRSPFPWINHTTQTDALRPLEACLPRMRLGLEDIAFTWTYTTQSITRDFKTVRDGLYGLGPLAKLAEAFPPEMNKPFQVRTSKDELNLHIVSGEQLVEAAKALLKDQFDPDKPENRKIVESQQFVAFHAVGSYVSPQFFPRCTAADGSLSLRTPDYKSGSLGGPCVKGETVLPLSQQTWRLGADYEHTFVRPERVTFLLTVPKKEYSRRPAPVVLHGHGYGSSELEPVAFGGFMARAGLASIAIEDVSHGLPFGDVELELIRAIAKTYDLGPLIDAVSEGRAFDQNGDGVADPGADFWTAYVFHTRDVLRQSAVDLMQLVRILRSFDGKRRWPFDLNGDGQPELAGDFDGDGEVDVGGDVPITMTGASLGGIMTTLMGGLEPQIEAVAPISGAAGLSDVGVRSNHPGVIPALDLRVLGPLLVTEPALDGTLELWQHVPDLNTSGRVKVGPMPLVPREGDTAVVINLRSGEHRCGRVQAGGLLRVAVSSDEGDPLRLEIYQGPLPPQHDSGCAVPAGALPSLVVESFAKDVDFQGRTHKAGDALIALGDGFGIKRGTPEYRRFIGLAQMGLDPADPINYAPFWENRRLVYGTGEEVRTRGVVLTTAGDMNVPSSAGVNIARAAGFVSFTDVDPRYGKTPNQVLIDTGFLMATERIPLHVNSDGVSVLMDVDNFCAIQGEGSDGFNVPRLSPPLRLLRPSARLGGIEGALFPFPRPDGMHVFNFPGTGSFDLGSVMIHGVARYLATQGREFPLDPCVLDESCSWMPPLPAPTGPQ